MLRCSSQQLQLFIPIVFHNPSGYDTHLFIKKLGKKFNKNDIGVIAKKRRSTINLIDRCRIFGIKPR